MHVARNPVNNINTDNRLVRSKVITIASVIVQLLLLSQTAVVTASESQADLLSEEKALVQPYHLNVAGDVGIQGVLDMGALNLGTGPIFQQIINVADPTGTQDAATKYYVDRQISNTVSSIGSCAVGSSIRAINSDGTVVCEDDTDTQYSAGSGLDLTDTEFTVDVPLHLNGISDRTIIRGTNSGPGAGVKGEHANGNWGFLGTQSYGVQAYSDTGRGVYGRSGSDIGVYGQHVLSGNFGYLGSTAYGVYTENANGNSAHLGGPNYAAYGQNTNGNYGYLGGDYGVYGNQAGGPSGYLGGSAGGAYGSSGTGYFGYVGYTSAGVWGYDVNTNNQGHIGTTEYGVHGTHGISGNEGHIGTAEYGVHGTHGISGNEGSLGDEFYGVRGEASGTDSSIFGTVGLHADGPWGGLGNTNNGVYGYATGVGNYAGYFDGDVDITGTISKGGGSFKIDHPLDPANAYLQHSFVESTDMMNVYNGNTTLDHNGESEVLLPEWFEALNRDFRYQLTAIGAPGPDLYIAEKISGNRFRIAGGAPSAEVSWQVTGIRQDSWAEANRIEVEVTKSAEEKGRYLHPELYGRDKSMGVSRLERTEP